MRFAIDFSHNDWIRAPEGQGPGRMLEIAQAADAGGIDAIWASEDPEGWDAFAALSAIAVVTERAVLGTSVTSPYPRHPNLLAASVATLDQLSAGRVVLGLGRGQPEWHGEALGVEIGQPVRVLAETVDLLRHWWSPRHRAASPPGGHFRVQGWERVTHPQQAHVPIYLAAVGPKALALAGTAFDGVIFNVLTGNDFLRAAIPRVREAAVQAGRDPAALAFILRTDVVLTEAADVVRRALDRRKNTIALISTLPGMDRLIECDGFDIPRLMDALRDVMRTEEALGAGGGFPALRREGDLAAARDIIPDALVRRLAIIGPLPVVRERLRELAALGITHVGVTPPDDAMSADAWRRLLSDLRG
jgi:alkanesulfonate monooxygenase SsuD/methylene tetrahydromethanopterin reductase-like flavin-dependent oxidoreductase (luciferase family)